MFCKPLHLVVLALGAMFLARGLSRAGESVDAAMAERIAALKATGPGAKVTIYPVIVQGRPNRMVADVLGLVLESCGMTNIDAVDGNFKPQASQAWDELAIAFGEYVKANPATGDYGLLAEYVGSPKTGPTEVRWLIVDRGGELVLSDRQTKSDADFKRTAARDPDPMGCSVLVGERVFSRTGWKKSESENPKGRFAKLWADKSGLPNEAEQTAMRQRGATLKTGVQAASVSVYPTRIAATSDRASAERIAAGLTKGLGCRASAASESVEIRVTPTPNEQKLLWDVARAFREHVRQHPPEGDYAVLADFLMQPPGGPVGGVHFVICDRAGEWVIVDFQNNQWPDFQRINPKSVEDCERLAVERVEKRVRDGR